MDVFAHQKLVPLLADAVESMRLEKSPAKKRVLLTNVYILVAKLDVHLEKLLPIVIKRGSIEMAKNTYKKGDYGYDMVDVRLSEADKAMFRKWVEGEGVDIDKLCVQPQHDGYKITQTYSENQDMHYVSYVGNGSHPTNPEKVLSSHAKNFYTAMLLNYWKHYIFFDGDKWVSSIRDGEDFG